MVDRTVGRRLFGERREFGDNRKVWKAFACRYRPSHSCRSWGTAEAKRNVAYIHPSDRERMWPEKTYCHVRDFRASLATHKVLKTE